MVRKYVCLGALLILSLLHVPLVSLSPQPQQKPVTISLPAPVLEGAYSFEEAVFLRRSVRNFAPEPLNLQQVSQLMWAAAGKTVDGISGPTRAYPSAGAMHPLELYIAAGNVEGLDPGIYQYQWDDHALLLISEGDYRRSLSDACAGQAAPLNAPATVVISAVYSRTVRRYGSRGEVRYVPMDAGASAQNVQLQAVALGLGSLMIGAFQDGAVQSLLKTSSAEPLIIMPVGVPYGEL